MTSNDVKIKAGYRPETFFKKRLQHRSCPVNFAKFLAIRFLQNTCGQLLVVLRSKFDLLSKSCSFLCTVLQLESKKKCFAFLL